MTKDRDSILSQLITLQSSSSPGGAPPADEAAHAAVRAASARLAESVSRHRSLASSLEASTSAQVRSLNLTVLKYSRMVKELSEEVARGKEGVRVLKEELAAVEEERNLLSKELEESRRPDYGRSESLLSKERRRTKEMRAVIKDMGARLERASRLLSNPRPADGEEQAATYRAGDGHGQHHQMLVKTLSAQLSGERNACKNALLQVERARADFKAREETLLARIASLENNLSSISKS